MKQRNLFLSFFAFFVFLLGPESAFAGTCGAGLDPILLVVTPVAFAIYDPSLGVDLTVNGSVVVSCTVVAVDTLPSFTVALSAGSGGGFAPRKMSAGSQQLSYNLFTSGAYLTVWGDGTGSTVTQTYSAGSGLSSQTYTVFGQIKKNQFVPTGIYGDSVTVTITY